MTSHGLRPGRSICTCHAVSGRRGPRPSRDVTTRKTAFRRLRGERGRRSVCASRARQIARRRPKPCGSALDAVTASSRESLKFTHRSHAREFPRIGRRRWLADRARRRRPCTHWRHPGDAESACAVDPCVVRSLRIGPRRRSRRPTARIDRPDAGSVVCQTIDGAAKPRMWAQECRVARSSSSAAPSWSLRLSG